MTITMVWFTLAGALLHRLERVLNDQGLVHIMATFTAAKVDSQ